MIDKLEKEVGIAVMSGYRREWSQVINRSFGIFPTEGDNCSPFVHLQVLMFHANPNQVKHPHFYQDQVKV